jgi:hypothetical protein
MTAAEAAAAGFRALTSPFHRRNEAAPLAAVIADMERGGIVHELIETAPGRVEVWRKNWVEMPNPTQTVVRGIRGRRD